MKDIAIGIFVILMLSIILEPLSEIANVLREKIALETALSNAINIAQDKSLIYFSMRDRDAEVDQDLLVEYFCEAFEATLGMYTESIIGTTIKFISSSGQYNPITVDLSILTEYNWETEQTIAIIEMNAESIYKFKTRLLQIADDTISSEYLLTGRKISILRIVN